MSSIDTERLRTAINIYERNAKCSGSGSCTPQDLNRAVRELSILLRKFVDELEKA